MSENFLSRWSKRKLEAKEQTKFAEPANPATPKADERSSGVNQVVRSSQQEPSAPKEPLVEVPLPTEADLAAVSEGGDVKAFMLDKVSKDLKNKAFKALFSRPEFNVMDGLDIYIDDYNKFTSLSQEDISKMTFSKQLLSRPDLEVPKIEGISDVLENGVPMNTQGEQLADQAANLEKADGVVDRSPSDSTLSAEEENSAEVLRVIPDATQATDIEQMSVEQPFENPAVK